MRLDRGDTRETVGVAIGRHEVLQVFLPEEREALKLLLFELTFVLRHEHPNTPRRLMFIFNNEIRATVHIVVERPKKECPCMNETLNSGYNRIPFRSPQRPTLVSKALTNITFLVMSGPVFSRSFWYTPLVHTSRGNARK